MADLLKPRSPSCAHRLCRLALAPFGWIVLLSRCAARAASFVVGFSALYVLLMVLGNVLFHSKRDIPYRSLDPSSPACISEAGWDILAKPPLNASGGPGVANDEWWTIDHAAKEWRAKFSCSLQHHIIPGYRAADGTERAIGYDLAFVEFKEDGKPYALRALCDGGDKGCVDEGYGPVRREEKGQLEPVLERLKEPGPHYVVIFIHGWRHDASIGDADVAEFRDHAAHAARFIEDRAGALPVASKPRVMAIYIGWRGARTDESGLKRRFGAVGEAIGSFSSALTLFDRKPVSEAIAPSVLSGLREIERVLDIRHPLATASALPPPQANRMIVFGHSLGGNLLATALKTDLIKKVERHEPHSYMLPILGDLVVLINPASEATKWTAIQRAVWDRIAVSYSERRPISDYIASHSFFRAEQRPILLSVTAALDWPPGGRREIDCAPHYGINDALAVSHGLANTGVQYDWATYDLFPAFKGDFRPLADTLTRIGTGLDPHDACASSPQHAASPWIRWPLESLSALLRVIPFTQTDPEQTHTIGHLDPPRGPGKIPTFTGLPIGTTHELRGWSRDEGGAPRAWSLAQEGERRREIPVDYNEIVGPLASCPVANGWLDAARQHQIAADANAHAVLWSSRDVRPRAPALIFQHGFSNAGLPAITRAYDPFWNMRAFDTALARHDGYMLSSFICAMNQLVMDDPTSFAATTAAGSGH